MNKRLTPILLFLFLVPIPHVSSFIDFSLLNVFENENIQIKCSEHSEEVKWRRRNSPFSEKAFVRKGILYIPKVKQSDAGLYICSKENRDYVLRLNVNKINSTSTKQFTTSSQLSYANFTTIGWSKFNTQVSTLTTPYPCLYGICNGTCCSETAKTYFECLNGEKIEKHLVCNNKNDCQDGSDESKCSPWPPKITVLPQHKVEIFCGDYDKYRAGTLILECESVGHPMPLITWKKYDGTVPSKCLQYSKNGHGILTCPDFQQSDQGAYSCIAENSVKTAESQPKSIAKCSNSINCKGFRVVNEEQIEHCLECYCSGKTTHCQNINLNSTIVKLSILNPEYTIDNHGKIYRIGNKTELINNEVRETEEKTYCAVNGEDLKKTSFLKSYGRNIIIPWYSKKTNYQTPDIVIQGNGVHLVHKPSRISYSKVKMPKVSVRFWPGNWYHLNEKPAKRKDIMKVLANVENIFVRCEKVFYQNDISLESSVVTSFTNSESYVEKCICPPGYEGLSCESCAPGYDKKIRENDFTCEKIPPKVCSEGYTGPNCEDCDTKKGYHKIKSSCVKAVCNPEGAYSTVPNESGVCSCRKKVTGKYCDQCEPHHFYLHQAKGCLECWCSGVTKQCNSSNWRRTVISNTPRGGYNSSDGRNFWLLPRDFSGNRLTSYGGFLNYSMKYKPNIAKENFYLTVEILSVDDVTLVYTHKTMDTSRNKDEKSWSVNINETHWKKSDRTSVTRSEFLSVLSKVKAIYIESPYHLSSGKANLTSTFMSSADLIGDEDSELALAVEQCKCPVGYTGLSCETCSQGYYKKRNGSMTQCIKCECDYCDPEFGCSDCPQLTYRVNPEEEKIPLCKPCPCSGNAISCKKDDFDTIFCVCKPGFSGIYCDKVIPKEKETGLTLSIFPRKIKNKKVGTVISLNCSYSGNEEMTLSVLNKYSNAPSSYKGAYNHSGTETTENNITTKTFEIALKEGMESIECYAFDYKGEIAGYIVAVVENLITVFEKVKILNCHSDKIEVKESESKEIFCEAKGSPTPLLSWYVTKKGSTVKKSVETSDGVHTIETATLDQNGTVYTCFAENSEGDKDSCEKTLIVHKKCEVINIIPKQIIVEEGEHISIQCKTTAKSPTNWSKKNYYGETPVYSFGRVNVSNGSLSINNSVAADSGIYICSAMGENGKINKTISVTVEEKKIRPAVKILEYDQTIKTGEDLEIHCVATGKPTPKVSWSKINGTLESNMYSFGGKLKLNHARVENSGVYICEANSSLGSAVGYISIKVKETYIAPKVNVSVETLSVHEGDVMDVVCLAVGYPLPHLNWTSSMAVDFKIESRKINEMILLEPYQSVEETISFKVTKDMDELMITCSGENEGGKSDHQIKIKVLQKTSSTNETVEFVPIGSYFELNCGFDENLKRDKIDGLVGDECPIPFGLLIPSVQVQHNGTYLCKENEEIRKKIHLIVVGFVPKFSKTGNSYMVLPMQMNSSSSIRIEASFKSTNQNGLLLQKENNKLSIYLEKRKIHLRAHCNKGDFLTISMNKAIPLEEWFSLVVIVSKNHIDMNVYNEKTETYDKKTETSKDFNITMGHGNESFFIGGIARRRHHHESHFDGSISRLSIDSHEFNIVKEGVHSQNVSLTRRCTEESNLCKGRGKCLDAPTQYGFICVCPKSGENKRAVCPPGCAGKGCETRLDLCTLLNPCNKGPAFSHSCKTNVNSLECNCAYGYTGTTCQIVQEHAFCAKENGFVRLPSNVLERHLGEREIIQMSFTLNTEDGQLLWQGDESNYLSILVSEGKLKYIYSNQLSKLTITAVNELKLNRKYSFLSVRLNETVTLHVNGSTNEAFSHVFKNSTDTFYTNRVTGDIYLGNTPNITLKTDTEDGLNGCIHYVKFGNKDKINLPEKVVEKLNVQHTKGTSTSEESDDEDDEEEDDDDDNDSNVD